MPVIHCQLDSLPTPSYYLLIPSEQQQQQQQQQQRKYAYPQGDSSELEDQFVPWLD